MMRVGALRHVAVAAVAATAALALAACGGSDGGETAAAPSPPTPSRAKAPPAVGEGRGDIALTKLGEFASPLYVTQPPGGGDLFVVEKGGTIRVLHNGAVEPQPFLDISERVSGELEQGLLSMAFAPDYESSGRFYVDYTDRAGDSRIVEYRRSTDNPLRADPSTARQVLFQDQPFPNHNGGLLLFGPDGKLYIGFGDGGSEGDPERNGQDLGTLLGKILRINPRPGGGRPYTVPADNPFAGKAGARPEIFIYGVRNPWRFSFDRAKGALTIGDVGQDTQEEIDYLPAGRAAGQNLGWSAFEGTHPFNRDQMPAVKDGWWSPALFYGRDEGCSVTGGYVVRDRNLRSLYGRYLYGDYCAGQLRSFIPAPHAETGRDDRELGLQVPELSSFGEDSAGRIYVTSLAGPVYRLDPKG
jgi:glucose/arabinose dehydrogenase